MRCTYLAITLTLCISTPSRAAGPPSPILLGRHSIRQEAGPRQGTFIAPNEARGHVFNRLLKGKAREGVLSAGAAIEAAPVTVAATSPEREDRFFSR